MCDVRTRVCIALAVPWDMQDVQLSQGTIPKRFSAMKWGQGVRLPTRAWSHALLSCAPKSLMLLALLLLIPRAAE